VISDGRQEEDSPASHALDSHTGTLAKTYGGWGEDASSIWDGATKTLTARVINSDTSATDLIVATANVTSGLSLPIYVFAGSTSDTSSGGGDFQAFAGNGWYGGSLVFAGGSSDVGTGGNGGNCEFYPGISLTGGANGFTTFYSGLFGGTPVISIYDDTVSSYFSLFSATGIDGTDTPTKLSDAIRILGNMGACIGDGTGVDKFGDVAGGNYSEFEADGTLRFYGNATVWQDIDFPIIIRTTGANIPTLVTLQGNVTAPQWSVNDFSVCEAQELVHAWKEGSQVQWHVHFVTNGLDATNRYVNFEVEWFWVNPNGTLSATITSSGDTLIPANTPTKTMLIRQVTVATFAGVIGGHVYARLRRIASIGTAPTGDPWCSMLQLHIECDTVGSRQISTK